MGRGRGVAFRKIFYKHVSKEVNYFNISDVIFQGKTLPIYLKKNPHLRDMFIEVGGREGERERERIIGILISCCLYAP